MSELQEGIFGGFQGKKALVIGGTRGIGRSISEGLHALGAEVTIVGRRDTVADTAREIQEMPAEEGRQALAVHGIKGDTSVRETRKELFDTCLASLSGQLDIMIYDAGVVLRNHPTLEYSYEDYDNTMNLNVEGLFYMNIYAIKAMLPNKHGKIVNISSVAGMRALPNGVIYSASKGAVIAMTKSLACEFAAEGIRINSVAPGFTVTDLAQKSLSNPERMKGVYDGLPVKILAYPKDIRGAALFLAPDAADYITGMTIPVDGGSTAK